MNPTAIYSKSGKGVQEASGKTSHLERADRAVLSAIDGRATLADVAQKVGRTFDSGFQQLVTQLDKDGFIREVSAGTAPAAKPRAPGKPAAKPSALTEPMDAASDLDFSSLGAAKPASPPPAAKARAEAERIAKDQTGSLEKARLEAEAKAQAERDRIKMEVEAKMRAELESKARAEAEAKLKAAREAAVRAVAEAKAKADADARAKVEAERKAREAAERKAMEEAERARKQLEEERRKLEEERKREEEERAARRKREEEEEQARRKQREEEEEARQKQREEQERRAEEERAARRKQREEEEERQAEEERAARRKQREEEKQREPQETAQEKPREKPKVEAKPAPKTNDGLDSLLADLDSFTQRDEDERKANEEAEGKARAEAERKAREDAERREREEAERKAKEAERARREDEARRRKEEEERLAREQEKEQARLREEEELRKREAEERARKAKEEEVLEAKATRGPAVPIGEDTDEVRHRMLGKRGAAAGPSAIEAPSKYQRPSKRSWGKPVAITLVLLLVAAVGVAHVMPISSAQYERAASEALGRPVKIGAARLSLYSGVQLHFTDVRIGDEVTIASVAGSPEIDALRGEKKIFSRIDLEGVKAPQQALGEVLFARVKGENFAVGRVVAKHVELTGPVTLPKALEADLSFGADGAITSATLRGPDNLVARLAPKGSSIEFEMTASGFTLPIVPEVTLSDFGMKGTATQRGMSIAEWGGKLLGGTLTGTAKVRWGGTWNVEGLITARNINAAVFAPALLSDGKAEGTGKFSMSGAEPAKLATAGRVEGSFTVSMGVLGSFDLARAIQSSGKTVTGRTQFAEMNGQAVYDRGAVALRNVTIGAGALNAGASADIAQSGALSGRIVADMKTANQTLRATLNLGGTVKEPQVRN